MEETNVTASASQPVHGSNGQAPTPQHSPVNGTSAGGTSVNGTRPHPALLAAGDGLAASDGLAAGDAVGLPVEQGERQRAVDLAAAERAAADFLTALGVDLDREQRRTT